MIVAALDVAARLPPAPPTYSLELRADADACSVSQGNIADLAESLVRTAPRGTTVTVVSEEKPEVTPWKMSWICPRGLLFQLSRTILVLTGISGFTLAPIHLDQNQKSRHELNPTEGRPPCIDAKSF